MVTTTVWIKTEVTGDIREETIEGQQLIYLGAGEKFVTSAEYDTWMHATIADGSAREVKREPLFNDLKSIRSLREWATGVLDNKVLTTPHTSAETVLDLLDFIEGQQSELAAERARFENIGNLLRRIAEISGVAFDRDDNMIVQGVEQLKARADKADELLRRTIPILKDMAIGMAFDDYFGTSVTMGGELPASRDCALEHDHATDAKGGG